MASMRLDDSFFLSMYVLDDTRAHGVRRLRGWKDETEDGSVASAGHGSWSDCVAIQPHTAPAVFIVGRGRRKAGTSSRLTLIQTCGSGRNTRDGDMSLTKSHGTFSCSAPLKRSGRTMKKRMMR
jgi:hypothetical protein